jgi:NCAIR mutase (PurE)-related protein
MSSDEIKLDLQRHTRLGFDEAIFCENKTSAQIVSIVDIGLEAGRAMLLTRLKPTTYGELPERIATELDYQATSGTAFLNAQLAPDRMVWPASVGIVTAGTSDAFVAREADRTLAFYGVETTLYFDVGVAGLWRLLERLEDIHRHHVVIAVAGMDAALPSVLGGLVRQPLIAVPTSTGYGAARGGETALAACLASCAPGVVVCNIDNGYGAACAALRILNATLPQRSD